MNATATIGIWEEQLSSDVKMIYDTNRSPERITIQKQGDNPLHFDYDNIREEDIIRVRARAKEAYNIK
jgi:hypothetical protein